MKRMYRMLMVTLLVFSLFSCEKEEEDGLTEPTQTGANTMSAKIDGRNWVHKTRGVLNGGGLDVDYYPDKSLFISGGRLDEHFDNTMWLSVTDVDHVGDYVLREESSLSYGMVNDYRDRDNSKAYVTTASSTGKMTITKLDTQNRIISGTFSFRAPLERSTTEYVDVTDGRFDVKY